MLNALLLSSAHLCLLGLEPAVSLHPVLCMTLLYTSTYLPQSFSNLLVYTVEPNYTVW